MKRKTHLKSCLLVSLFLLGIHSAAFAGDIIYVKASTSPRGDGQSWDSAYDNLQAGLDDADPCDVIWVAAGTYYPSVEIGGSGSYYKTFQMKNGVGIYGGFPNTGDPCMPDRNPGTHKTILSGEDRCYHVFYHPSGTNLDSTAMLDGVTITGGDADGSGDHTFGGGMYNRDNSSPTVTGCTFASNSAYSCGGMYNEDSSSPTVTDCTFTGNSAHYAGGMYNRDSSSPTVTDCTFVGNSADEDGGGMSNCGGSSPTITGCTFSGNSTNHSGGGMRNSGSSPTVTNCTFSGNSASAGGGISNLYSSITTLINCIFWGNTAVNGPQIYNVYSSTSIVTYSCIQDGYSGTGNIDADPLFVDAGNDDVHLKSYSPCIDAGDPAGDYSGQTDMDGLQRVRYDFVDMGVYEVYPIAGDFEPDEDVDLSDFAIFSAHWLTGTQ